MKNKVDLRPRRSFKNKAYCVLLAFVFFKLKSLQTEKFAICFVVCFVIRGLAKNKEGKDLEDVLITCTAEVRKMRVIMKMRSYKYKGYTKSNTDVMLTLFNPGGADLPPLPLIKEKTSSSNSYISRTK